MRHLHMPRFLGNGTVFMTIVIVALCWLAFRGCALPAITSEQRASEQATLIERQLRWDEQRAERGRRQPFNLIIFILSRLAALVLITGAIGGAVGVLTLRGIRWAATIQPTGGIFPIVIGRLGGTWRIHDPNKQIAATTRLNDGHGLLPVGWETPQLAITAGAQQVQAEQARSYSAVHGGVENVPMELEQSEPIMQWPGRVPLTRYLDAQGGANLDNIFMGVTCDPATGGQIPVSMGMSDLVHFAVAGSSGFGKTTFVESLLYQFVKSGACDLAIVDLKAELVAWQNANALRWPVATTRQDGSAILTACYDELQSRKGAFQSVGGAKSLADYNSRANGNVLRPLVAVLDEGTVLLRADKELTDRATDLVLLGRPFGLWLVLAAQNFKVNSTASEIRDQLTTRVQFHAQDGNQARILLGHDKAQGLGVGRAICRLKGQDDLELQAPVVTRQEIDTLLRGHSGPRQSAPVVDVEPVKVRAAPVARLSANQEAYILELGEQGLSTTAIQKEVWGAKGKSGSRARAVNELLGRE